MSDRPQYHLSKENLAKVFGEWKRRYDEDPDSFQSDEDFKNDPPKTYGEGAARYFTKVVKDILEPNDSSSDDEEPEIVQ